MSGPVGASDGTGRHDMGGIAPGDHVGGHGRTGIATGPPRAVCWATWGAAAVPPWSYPGGDHPADGAS